MTLILCPRKGKYEFSLDVTGLTFDEIQDLVKDTALRYSWPNWMGRFGFLTHDDIYYAPRTISEI